MILLHLLSEGQGFLLRELGVGGILVGVFLCSY